MTQSLNDDMRDDIEKRAWDSLQWESEGRKQTLCKQNRRDSGYNEQLAMVNNLFFVVVFFQKKAFNNKSSISL